MILLYKIGKAICGYYDPKKTTTKTLLLMSISKGRETEGNIRKNILNFRISNVPLISKLHVFLEKAMLQDA